MHLCPQTPIYQKANGWICSPQSLDIFLTSFFFFAYFWADNCIPAHNVCIVLLPPTFLFPRNAFGQCGIPKLIENKGARNIWFTTNYFSLKESRAKKCRTREKETCRHQEKDLSALKCSQICLALWPEILLPQLNCSVLL